MQRMKEMFREGIARLREAVYRITGYKVRPRCAAFGEPVCDRVVLVASECLRLLETTRQRRCSIAPDV